MYMHRLEIEAIEKSEFEAKSKLPGAIVLSDRCESDRFWEVLGDSPPILLSNEWYGLRPVVYRWMQDRICAGVFTTAFLIRAGQVTWEANLLVPIYQCVYATASEFVVQHEVGFICFSEKGDILWSADEGEYIGWHEVDGHTLYYRYMDDTEKREVALPPDGFPVDQGSCKIADDRDDP